MPITYREEKATQAAARLLQLVGGKLNHMKLIKLLYVADRRALLRFGRPITFDWYVSMPHGPVLSFTLDKINDSAPPDGTSYWHRVISDVETMRWHSSARRRATNSRRPKRRSWTRCGVSSAG
jgi:uncharacterized phage-associated protein